MTDKLPVNETLETQIAELTRTLDDQKQRVAAITTHIDALRKQIADLQARVKPPTQRPATD